MSGPYFPVNLGNEALQTDPEKEFLGYGISTNPVTGGFYDTQRGRRTDKSPIPQNVPDGFGRYED